MNKYTSIKIFSTYRRLGSYTIALTLVSHSAWIVFSDATAWLAAIIDLAMSAFEFYFSAKIVLWTCTIPSPRITSSVVRPRRVWGVIAGSTWTIAMIFVRAPVGSSLKKSSIAPGHNYSDTWIITIITVRSSTNRK